MSERAQQSLWYLSAAAEHIVVSIEPRDPTQPPAPENLWIKRMFVTAWRIEGFPESSTPLLLEVPAQNAWWGHLGPDGSILQPDGRWFPSLQAMQEAYLTAWQELWDAGATVLNKSPL